MLSQGQVGPISSTADGVQVALRAGKQGDQIVSELHGRYYESAYRRAQFLAANQAAQATSAALATTYTGLCISNPVGSSINVVLEKVGITLAAAPAAIAPIGLMVGYNASTNVTHTAAVTPRNSFVGVGAAPVALVDSSATLPTAPTVAVALMGGFTAAALPGTGPALVDLEGAIILPPGAYAAIYTLTATSGIFSFQWEETPV